MVVLRAPHSTTATTEYYAEYYGGSNGYVSNAAKRGSAVGDTYIVRIGVWRRENRPRLGSR